MKKKLCIIGASGDIGQRMYNTLVNTFPEYEIIGTCFQKKSIYLENLDVTDYNMLYRYLLNHMPYIIIWLSGSKDVKKCQINEEFAYSINTTPIKFLIEILKNNNIKSKLIYISTDYVFDGLKGSYLTSDNCNPLTNYGKSKLKAEMFLIESELTILIIRTSAVLINGKGFLGWLKSEFEKNNKFSLFENTYFSPIPIEILNKAIEIYILKNDWKKNIIHISGPRLTRFDFGKYFANFMGYDKTLLLKDKANFTNSTFQRDISLVPDESIRFLSINSWENLFKYL